MTFQFFYAIYVRLLKMRTDFLESSRDGGGKRQFTAGCSFRVTPIEQPGNIYRVQNYAKKEV